MRACGYLVGIALIIAGIVDAVARDWTIDGRFLLLAGAGFLIVVLAKITEPSPTPVHADGGQDAH